MCVFVYNHSIIFAVQKPARGKCLPFTAHVPYNTRMIHTPDQRDTQLILAGSTAVFSYAAIALLAALCGVFVAPVVIGAWLGVVGLLTATRVIVWRIPSRTMLATGIGALALAATVAIISVPTIFDGRDQGSLADAAIRLADTHTLSDVTPQSNAFFRIYGRGQALNFPGYFYAYDGALQTQFPLPYIAFLAGFYGVFGMTGFVAGNAVLLVMTIIALVYVSQYFMARRWSMVFFVAVACSFPPAWFAKYTLSENLAGTLVWSAFALLLTLWRSPHPAAWYALWTVVGILAVTRVEGTWFALFFTVGCAAAPRVRAFVRDDIWRRLYVPAALTVAVGVSVLVHSVPFLTVMAKALLNESSSLPTDAWTKITALAGVYTLYGMIIPLCASIVACGAVIWRNRVHGESLFPLLPMALVGPLVLYYIFPHITADHPWMLRRYSFALANAMLLTSMIFVARIPVRTLWGRVARVTIAACIIVAQLPAFLYFLPYAENRGLTTQIHDIARTFTPHDLVLVDRNATGSGWHMMTVPLRVNDNIPAVYFFNLDDLSRLTTADFSAVYVIAPDDETTIVNNAVMRPVAAYRITTSRLAPTSATTRPWTFPEKRLVDLAGTVYHVTR